MTPHTHTAQPAHDGPRVVAVYDPASPWPGKPWVAHDGNIGGYGATAEDAREDFLWNWMEAHDATPTAN